MKPRSLATIAAGAITALTALSISGCAARSAPVVDACTRDVLGCPHDLEHVAPPAATSQTDGPHMSMRDGKHSREPRHASHEVIRGPRK